MNLHRYLYWLRNAPNRLRELTHGRHRWLRIGGVWRLDQRNPGMPEYELGVVSRRIVTDAALAHLAKCYAAEPGFTAGVFKYVASGIGTRSGVPIETSLQTEVGTRAVCSQTWTATTFVAVGVLDYTDAHDITEFGMLSAASLGTLLDRAKVAAMSVVNGTSIRSTFTLTLEGA